MDGALIDARPQVRDQGLAALAASHRRDARAQLLAALSGGDGHARFAAAQGLQLLADPSTAPDVVKAWRREKGWAVKKELCAAAVAVHATELVPDLKTAYAYETKVDVREALAWALDGLGDPSGQVALAQLGHPTRKQLIKEGADGWSRHVLLGKKPGDERLAVRTLALMGTAEDLSLLRRMLESADPETRLWAAAGFIRWSH